VASGRYSGPRFQAKDRKASPVFRRYLVAAAKRRPRKLQQIVEVRRSRRKVLILRTACGIFSARLL
jgi:hypothetical protein